MFIFEKKKIELLKKKIELIRQHAHQNGRFSLFDAQFSKALFDRLDKYKDYRDYFDLINGWDKDCKIALEDGLKLDKEATENAILVNRVNLYLDKDSEGLPYDDVLLDHMKYGISNNGQVAQGAISNTYPSLSVFSTILQGLAGYINLLASYKNNDTIFLVRLPKKFVNNDGNVIDNSLYEQIYYKLEGETKYRIKPEYTYGVILKKSDGSFQVYSRDEVVEQLEHQSSPYSM